MKAGKPRLRLFDDTGMAHETRRALNTMILSVLFGNVCFTVTNGTALTGLVKDLGASDFIFSVLVAMPVIGNLAQLLSSYFLERSGKRKFLLTFFGIISRMSWLVVGVAPFVFPNSAPTALWTILLFVTLNSCTGAFVSSSFFSLVADVVPMRIRGRYFAVRQRLMMLVGIAAGIIIGMLLDAIPGLAGYAVVFAIAAAFGTADIVCFFFVKFPPMAARRKTGFFAGIAQVLRDKRFIKMVLFLTAWCFSVNFAGPFFNVYMLQVIGMSFTQITIFSQISSNIMTLFCITRWGRIMDNYGNKPVLRLCATLAAFLPFIWLFNGPGQFAAVVVVQVLSGLLWPAIDLSTQNLYLAQSPRENRSVYVAVYFAMTQIFGVAFGIIAGGAAVKPLGLLADALNWRVFGFAVTKYNLLFVCSALLRLITMLGLFRLVQEDDSKTVKELLRGMRLAAAEGWRGTKEKLKRVDLKRLLPNKRK